MPAIDSKKKYENFGVFGHLIQNYANLVRNVQRFKTHVKNYCSSHLTIRLVTFSVVVVSVLVCLSYLMDDKKTMRLKLYGKHLFFVSLMNLS